MDNKFNTFIESAKRLSLREERKRAMREGLLQYAEMRPIPPHQSVHGSVFALLFLKPVYAVLAAFLIVGVSGVGVSYAALGAVPGDTLYPVKIAIVERIERTLAVTAAQKQAVAELQIARRIEEHAILALRTPSSPSTSEQLRVVVAREPEHAVAVAQKLESRGYTEAASLVRAAISSQKHEEPAPPKKVAVVEAVQPDASPPAPRVSPISSQTPAPAATKTTEDVRVSLLEQVRDAQIALDKIKLSLEEAQPKDAVPQDNADGVSLATTTATTTPVRTVEPTIASTSTETGGGGSAPSVASSTNTTETVPVNPVPEVVATTTDVVETAPHTVEQKRIESAPIDSL